MGVDQAPAAAFGRRVPGVVMLKLMLTEDTVPQKGGICKKIFTPFCGDDYYRGMPKKSGLVTPREKEIGRRVKRFREQINWPQPAFAIEMEISRDRLASIEYARTPLRYDVGYRLCFIFDVSHEWLATGAGEMRASTAAADLPIPESQRRTALFSTVWDQLRKGGTLAGKKKAAQAAAGNKKGNLIRNFDPAAHVARFMADLFAREKFRSPIERQEFALEVTSYARELSLRLKREAAKSRFLASSDRRSDQTAPARNARLAVKLGDGILRLEREIGKLHGAMSRLNPVSVNPSALPPAAGEELVRLQETIDKIAAQIEEAEGQLRSVVPRKTGA